MQPAYYENLEEIQKKLWSMLDDAVVNRSSPFRMPVFICTDQNDIDGRIVVLRKSDKNKNKVYSAMDTLVEKYGSMEQYYEVSEIQCRVKETGSIYVSAEGLVLPCCWTAGRMYKWWHKDPKVEQVWQFIDAVGGKESLNAINVGLGSVFDTGIFEKIEESWNIKGCGNGRLKVCAMKCSKQFDVVGSQYE